MNKIVIIIALIIVLLGGFLLIQSQKKSVTPTPAPTSTMTSEPTASQPTTATSPAMTGEQGAMKPSEGTVKEFTVTAKNFSFSPSTMTVNKGDAVKITVKNEGGFHDLTLDAFNVETKQLQSGQQETIEFTADKAGTFEYYCSVGNHRAMGMKGTLTVN